MHKKTPFRGGIGAPPEKDVCNKASETISHSKSIPKSRSFNAALRQLFFQIFNSVFSGTVHEIKIFYFELFQDVGSLFKTHVIRIFQVESAHDGVDGQFGEHFMAEKQSIDDT